MSGSPHKAELLLRKLEWTVIRRLDGALHGDYRTLFRGFGLDRCDVIDHREAQIAATDHEPLVVRQLVLAALLAVDDELGLLRREHGVHLAVEVDRVAVGDERIRQHDVVIRPRSDRRDLLVQVVDGRWMTGCSQSKRRHQSLSQLRPMPAPPGSSIGPT